MPPRKQVPERQYVYLGGTHASLEIADIAGKGKGVKAVMDLDPNARIVYTGVPINDRQFEALEARAEQEPGINAYIMASGNAGSYLDAHPRRGDYLAGKINEPSPKQTANMRLAFEKDGDKMRSVLVAVRLIKAGEEVTYKYGTGFRRTYKVGREAPKPWWWDRK